MVQTKLNQTKLNQTKLNQTKLASLALTLSKIAEESEPNTYAGIGFTAGAIGSGLTSLGRTAYVNRKSAILGINKKTLIAGAAGAILGGAIGGLGGGLAKRAGELADAVALGKRKQDMIYALNNADKQTSLGNIVNKLKTNYSASVAPKTAPQTTPLALPQQSSAYPSFFQKSKSFLGANKGKIGLGLAAGTAIGAGINYLNNKNSINNSNTLN